ncbi:hypothetical protein [Saccharothrix longispora]|uniref:hypothetical protein n=1 Tax=Saccharothrix longispora TaxID=33920 RepID=UPI0028FD58E5|nr:hypothetical protein [Saccharothrix longispora]MDU0293697.1 hypothetical protein [Saccharothrix longispora]
MSRAWDRPSDDPELLRCFQILDLPELPARVLAVGTGLDPAELEYLSTRHGGTKTGLLRLGDDLFGWTPEPPPLPPPWEEPARLTARRIGEDLLTTLDTACDLLARPVDGFDHHIDAQTLPPIRFADPSQATAWLRAHLPVSLAAVRATGMARLSTLATALSARLWACVPTDAPGRWALDLTDAGTRAAVDARKPHLLARLLGASARWFATHGDHATAEAHGVREWAVWKELHDTDGMIDTLWRRARLYREAGRGNRELDCHQRLLSLYRRTGDRFGLARAQAARGVALLAAGRTRDGAEQLREAARSAADPGDFPQVPPGELAAVLETLGRAFWSIGSTGAARRQFSGALRLLVDVDEQAAHRIRTLLATPDGRPLPADPDA